MLSLEATTDQELASETTLDEFDDVGRSRYDSFVSEQTRFIITDIRSERTTDNHERHRPKTLKSQRIVFCSDRQECIRKRSRMKFMKLSFALLLRANDCFPTALNNHETNTVGHILQIL